MAERTLEEIFNDKNQLHDFFPASSDTKVYDVQRKHFLYGKIDRDGDAVYIEETYLAQIDAGELEIKVRLRGQKNWRAGY